MGTSSANVAANPEDVSSVNGAIRALYESVSFQPGKQPDYARLRTILHPRAVIVPPRAEHTAELLIHDVESFISQSRLSVISTGLEGLGFHEKETARRSESFGNVVSVFSTYESRHRESDPTPIQRGINSIELMKDARRWWVIAILWDIEKPTNPIPKEYEA